jgi:hypothetical protein
LTVETGTGPADRDAHYRLCAKRAQSGHAGFSARFFDAVLDLFGDDADILTIRRRRAGGQRPFGLSSWRGHALLGRRHVGCTAAARQ